MNSPCKPTGNRTKLATLAVEAERKKSAPQEACHSTGRALGNEVQY